MPGRKSGTELDDLNLHVKSPLPNDLASRFGDPSFELCTPKNTP
jgi:hypothetical protein